MCNGLQLTWDTVYLKPAVTPGPANAGSLSSGFTPVHSAGYLVSEILPSSVSMTQNFSCLSSLAVSSRQLFLVLCRLRFVLAVSHGDPQSQWLK